MNSTETELVLKKGIYLNNRYLLEKVLGIGGFGITYLALDIQLQEKVAIKEFFPFQYAYRDTASAQVLPNGAEGKEIFTHGLQVFKREVGILSKFSGNQNIVQVKECFEENNTCYFSMEFLDGVNAKALMRSMGGMLPLGMGREILETTAKTLKEVHNLGLLHRDISPENIFITKQGETKLIDFGATRMFVGEKSRSLSVVLKPGFAPAEQYTTKGNQGPWTDIYALCATVYLLVTGNTIPDVPSRIDGETFQPLHVMFPEIDEGFDIAITNGLQMDYRKRPQNVSAFLKILENQQTQPNIQPNIQPINQPNIQPYVQVILSGIPGDVWAIPVNQLMKIGRSSEQCHIVLDEPQISRVHCTIQYDARNQIFQLSDVSSNGTYFVNVRLERNRIYSLKNNEVFHLLSNQIVMKVWTEYV